jgi:non-ribosomal peptide synthetase component F
MERSLELIVAVLAVMMAGGAYVPMDPSLPETRLQYIAEDTKAKIILSSRGVLNRVKLSGPQTFIALDEFKISQPKSDLRSTVQLWHAVYVVYTSGSTGNPKGLCFALLH